ncbi:uncharacterized protein M6B38_363165 [Iris pallida]|uniref:Uncharacterized protein n=1 Tax=Iris pallida TaxID=29817 RepID=A0AAX6GI48_IRIPA|nr:uncharacterized protein M6B38_413025 [Iris pallida]KAJ6828379.1 uncharacterized protein M6B38_363165 [Iris pallida]
MKTTQVFQVEVAKSTPTPVCFYLSSYCVHLCLLSKQISRFIIFQNSGKDLLKKIYVEV